MDLRTADGLSRAIALFKEALALEPGFTDASAALAQTYNLAVQYGVLAQNEGYPLALATARAVLSREPDHPGGLAALAFNTFYWLRNFSTAYDLFEAALKFNPNNADAHHWYALAVMHDRQFDIALREIEMAQQLSPTSPSILTNKALILHHAGSSDAALAILEPLAASQPMLLSPVSYLATIYLDIGRNRDFVTAYGQAADLTGNVGRKEITEAARQGVARAGRSGMLNAMLGVQTRLSSQGQERAFKVAITAAYLERTDLALDNLELAIQRNEPDVLGVRLELPSELLRGLPRYMELITRIGFSA
jgi:tetratricopeptide (TPR) repeat protein